MERSIGASASISSSPTANHLVTPLIETSGSRLGLSMMLRTPAQQPIAQANDQSVRHETANADHDHARDDEIGARQRPAVHDHRAEAGRNASHFTHHDQGPGGAGRGAQAGE